MIVYNFHPVSGEFFGTTTAERDPLETEKAGHDVFMLPAHATFTAPPTVGKNKAAVWTGDQWATVDDYRGTVYWLGGERHQIAELGKTVLDGAALTEPTTGDQTASGEPFGAILSELARRRKLVLKLPATAPQTDIDFSIMSVMSELLTLQGQKASGDLSHQQQTRLDELTATERSLALLLARSNALQEMTPRPDDVTSDKWWQ